MSKQKLPKFIKDDPEKDDFFSIHNSIAETLLTIIQEEDLKKRSFTYGLFGEWGSGKSLVVHKLKSKIEKLNEPIVFVELDVWKYVDTYLYRSVLFDLNNEFRNLAEKKNANKIIKEHFKDGFKIDGYSLQQELNLTLPKDISDINKSGWVMKIKTYLHKYWKFLSFFGLVLYLTYVTGSELSELNSINSWVHNKFLPFRKLIEFSWILGGIAFFQEGFKNLFQTLIPKTQNKEGSSPPTFAQDRFEYIFTEMIKKASDNGKQKIVLVFDNIDRCDMDTSFKILSGLKTFLNTPFCFFIVPCDENIVFEQMNTNTHNYSAYFDKIFNSHLKIPILESKKQLHFIKEYIKECEFELTSDEENRIIQMFVFAFGGNTPRQILKYFNGLVSFYRLALQIDPEQNSILKNKTMFFFMMTIKLKWPLYESVFIDEPSVFKKLMENNQALKEPNGKSKLDMSFEKYIDNCRSWIDFEDGVGKYIFFDAKNEHVEVNHFFSPSEEVFNLDENSILAIQNEFILSYHNLYELAEKYSLKFTVFWNNDYQIGLKKQYVKSYFEILKLLYQYHSHPLVVEHLSFISDNHLLQYVEPNMRIQVHKMLMEEIRPKFNDETSEFFDYLNKFIPNKNEFDQNFFIHDIVDLNYVLKISPESWKIYMNEFFILHFSKKINIEFSDFEELLLDWLIRTGINMNFQHQESNIIEKLAVGGSASKLKNVEIVISFIYKVPLEWFSEKFREIVSNSLGELQKQRLRYHKSTQNFKLFLTSLKFSQINNFSTFIPTGSFFVKEFWINLISHSKEKDWENWFDDNDKLNMLMEYFYMYELLMTFYNKIGFEFINTNLETIIKTGNVDAVIELLKTINTWSNEEKHDDLKMAIVENILDSKNASVFLVKADDFYENLTSDRLKAKYSLKFVTLFTDIRWLNSENYQIDENMHSFLDKNDYFGDEVLRKLIKKDNDNQ